MPLLKMSPRQRMRLSEAKAATDPDEFFYAIYRTVVERGDEPLSAEWLALWKRWSGHVTEIVPAQVIRRVEKALEAINPVDDEIFKIRPSEDHRVAILLGAGASAPEPSSIPTVPELLPELLRRAKKIGREEIDRLAAWCERNDVGNIEDLLTAAYVSNFAAKNPSITGLLDYFLFGGATAKEEDMRTVRRTAPRRTSQVNAASIAHFQDTLQTLFGLLTGAMIPAKPNAAHHAIVRFLQAHDKTSIVTTNYDGCIDEALIDAQVPVQTYLETTASDESGGCGLIKMHGSINWSYCDSCQEIRQFDLAELKDAYEQDRLSYAVIGICKTCGGQRRPLLVPPLAFKFVMFPNLIRVWNIAGRRIEEADYLIVVGYSFSEADTYIAKIISRSLTANRRQKMVVCDTDATLVPSLREKFVAQIDAFDPSRVLQAVGSCDDLVPKILSSMVTTGPEGAKASPDGDRPARRGRKGRTAKAPTGQAAS